jgi:predicted nuclease of restriction endonuclease-like (RecB) superfamily
LRLHERQGVAVSNFAEVLGPPDAQTVLEATKDPYVFDFLELAEGARERHLEQALIDDIQSFLIELGTGFAFYSRQRSLLVGDQEFFPDLLFYHHTLRRFIVIELKVGALQPEYVSKMNFYLNAVDEQLRVGDDQESVGIILCTERNETVAKLALHRVYAPVAVSTWQAGSPQPTLPHVEVTDDLPDDLSELDEVRARLLDRVARGQRG